LREPVRGRFDPKREFESEEKSAELKRNKVLTAISNIFVGLKILVTNPCTRWLFLGNLSLNCC
jgi:hypothetical protein